MWEFDVRGDLYFEKAVNGFLNDLFAKWKVVCRQRLILLYILWREKCRPFVALQSEISPLAESPRLHKAETTASPQLTPLDLFLAMRDGLTGTYPRSFGR